MLAWCRQIIFIQGGLDEADKIAGLRHARAAIAGGGDDPTALAVAGMVMGHLGRDYETALSAIARALAVNPSCAAAHYFGAHISAFCGDRAAATAHAERALRLSPLDSLAFVAHYALGTVAVHEGRYEAAASCFARAAPGRSNFLFYQAMALALAGRMEEAATVAKRAMEDRPGLRLQAFLQIGMVGEIADKVAAGWRLLGLPE